MSITKKFKLKKLKLSKPCDAQNLKVSNERTLKVNTSMRIIADDEYLKQVEKHSRINEARRKSAEEASLAYADTHYVRHIT